MCLGEDLLISSSLLPQWEAFLGTKEESISVGILLQRDPYSAPRHIDYTQNIKYRKAGTVFFPGFQAVCICVLTNSPAF